mgnify:CR=1 FL=1
MRTITHLQDFLIKFAKSPFSPSYSPHKGDTFFDKPNHATPLSRKKARKGFSGDLHQHSFFISKSITHPRYFLSFATLVFGIWSCTPQATSNQTKEPLSKVVAGYDKLKTPAQKAPLAKAVKDGWKPASKAKVDAQIDALAKKLFAVQANTFYYSKYVTGATKTSLTFYRVFGNKARLGGSYVSSSPIKNKALAQKENALLSEWGNSIAWEAKIEVPKGTIVSVGVVGPQASTNPPQFLPGGADQILLPFGWLNNPNYKVAVRKLDKVGKPTTNFKEIPLGQRVSLEKAIQSKDEAVIQRIIGGE